MKRLGILFKRRVAATPLFYFLLVLGLAAFSFLMFIQTARGINFTVTKTLDTNDGVCDADCSLREAIGAANALPGDDTITLPAGVYTLTIAGVGEDLNATGDLDITDNLNLNGVGSALSIIDGNGIDRVFEIHPGATVEIDAVTIKNGEPAASGGGILNRDTLTITKSVVTENIGLDFAGGIYNLGSMTITDTTIVDNETIGFNLSGGGGGILNQGTMALSQSTVNGNMTQGRGGGVYNLDLSFTALNSTISGNTALNGGGLFNRFGLVSLTHTTTFDNTATDNGGGIWNFAGATTISRSLVSMNDAATIFDDCAGFIASTGHNIASDASCTFAGIGDANSTDPLLAPLADNGGLTETHAWLVGSPANDAVPLAFCTVAIDQRSTPRPQGAACDAGAYEDDGDGIAFDVDVCPHEPEDFDGVSDGDGCPEGSTACSGAFVAIIVGTGAAETLIGTPGPDHIIGGGGADKVFGLGGDDCIETGTGADFIDGGPGNDEIHAGKGGNRILGRAGRDTVIAGTGSDRIEAGDGLDEVDAGSGSNRVFGGDGDDVLTTGGGADLIDGGGGVDTCSPGGGSNQVISCEL